MFYKEDIKVQAYDVIRYQTMLINGHIDIGMSGTKRATLTVSDMVGILYERENTNLPFKEGTRLNIHKIDDIINHLEVLKETLHTLEQTNELAGQ